MILTEKYRPKTFNDVIGIDKRISAACNQDMPHFLFVGKCGTGKTTVAKIIIKELNCDSLELNASDERGINTIRDKVKSFAMTKSTNNKLKIVFLDEADKLTPDAQDSLRNIIEKYQKNCRFILTGNYVNKFKDAIVSRCVDIKFKEPDKTDILDKLMTIINTENIKINSDIADKIVHKYYPDMRKMINKLQELSNLGREITDEDINKEELIVEEIFKLLQDKKLIRARQLLLDNNVDYESMIIDTNSYIWKSNLDGNKKIKLIQCLCDCNKYMPSVISKELLFTSMMYDMVKVLV